MKLKQNSFKKVSLRVWTVLNSHNVWNSIDRLFICHLGAEVASSGQLLLSDVVLLIDVWRAVPGKFVRNFKELLLPTASLSFRPIEFSALQLQINGSF